MHVCICVCAYVFACVYVGSSFKIKQNPEVIIIENPLKHLLRKYCREKVKIKLGFDGV